MKPGFARVDGLPRALDLPEKTGINSLVAGALSDLGEGNILYSTKINILPLADEPFEAHNSQSRSGSDRFAPNHPR